MGCFKGCLRVHSSRSMEDSGPKSYLNCRDLAEEVSEEKNFNMLPRNHSCDILVKKVTVFCPLSKESA